MKKYMYNGVMLTLLETNQAMTRQGIDRELITKRLLSRTGFLMPDGMASYYNQFESESVQKGLLADLMYPKFEVGNCFETALTGHIVKVIRWDCDTLALVNLNTHKVIPESLELNIESVLFDLGCVEYGQDLYDLIPPVVYDENTGFV